jgi:hypothetical protein
VKISFSSPAMLSAAGACAVPGQLGARVTRRRWTESQAESQAEGGPGLPEEELQAIMLELLAEEEEPDHR